MNWRSPRFLLLAVFCIMIVGIGVVVVILIFQTGHAKVPIIAQKTVIPANERQIVQTYNQALVKQNWVTIYASTALSARSGHTQEEFIQLMSQQVQKDGTIVSITPMSNISNPEIKTNADYLTYFTVIEKVVIVKNGTSQMASFAFAFILENGTWKFFTSKKV